MMMEPLLNILHGARLGGLVREVEKLVVNYKVFLKILYSEQGSFCKILPSSYAILGVQK